MNSGIGRAPEHFVLLRGYKLLLTDCTQGSDESGAQNVLKNMCRTMHTETFIVVPDGLPKGPLFETLWTMSALFGLTVWANDLRQWFRVTMLGNLDYHSTFIASRLVVCFLAKSHSVHSCSESAMQPHCSHQMLRFTDTWQSDKQ